MEQQNGENIQAEDSQYALCLYCIGEANSETYIFKGIQNE
jgi:hypothetical protein